MGTLMTRGSIFFRITPIWYNLVQLGTRHLEKTRMSPHTFSLQMCRHQKYVTFKNVKNTDILSLLLPQTLLSIIGHD